jgi:general stress protein CsbA
MPDFLPVIVPIALLVLISSAARFIHLQLFQRYFSLTFEDAPVWSLFYFSFWTLVVVFFFPQEIQILFSQVTFLGYLGLFILLFVIFPAVYKLFKVHIGSPEWLTKIYPGQGMLTLEERYIFAKVGDVIFQQCVAGALLLTLFAYGFEYQYITAIFLILFTLAHIYIFVSAGVVWGMHFTAYAVLGGFAFPYFIIFVPAGIAYSIVLHMLFYVLSAVFFAKLPYPHPAVRRHIEA